jgi:hypothetical protein
VNRIPKTSLSFVWGIIMIPLTQNSPSWHSLAFSKIKPNTVKFSAEGLTIEVRSSSSPLFYKFPETLRLKKLAAEGTLSDLPQLKKGDEESQDLEDVSLRIGLVEPSPEPPSWLNKLLSPQWIKDILSAFPDTGIKKIRFFNLSQRKNPGFFRVNPDTDLIEETVIKKQTTSGKFKIEYAFPSPVPAAALWIQPDGDDTNSNFDLRLKRMEIETEENNH